MELVESCVFQYAGTNLSKKPSRSATMYAAELAQQSGTEVILDIDFRPNQWYDSLSWLHQSSAWLLKAKQVERVTLIGYHADLSN